MAETNKDIEPVGTNQRRDVLAWDLWRSLDALLAEVEAPGAIVRLDHLATLSDAYDRLAKYLEYPSHTEQMAMRKKREDG